MFQKLEDVEKKYIDLTEKISDPEVISRQNEWKVMMKEHSELEPIVEKYREYKKVEKQMEDAKEMMADKELKELAEADYYSAKEQLPKLEEELKTKIEEAKREQKAVYGVELQGDSNGAINVDHHTYGEDDRSNPKSSLEQVAEILGVELTLDEQFVSANDKGYIPAMEKLGAELRLSAEDLQEIISNIRMRDREMQGVTPEQEAQAQEAVEKLGEIKEKRNYIQLDLPHSKTSTVTDRLYGKYDNLLITSQDGETNFYGTTEIIKMLNEMFGGWLGGQLDQGSGYWGGYADQNAIKAAVQEALQKTIDSTDNREEL